MDLVRLAGFNKTWAKYPPVHVSMAAYVGWNKTSSSSQSADVGDPDAFMASLPTQEFVNGR